MEWTSLVLSHLGDDAEMQVLDLGTGGGHHLYHLFHQMPNLKEGVAVDLSGEMLERVSALIPQVEILENDMTTVDLGRTYPFISVHDSFCYLTETNSVQRLFQVIQSHLALDGLALVKLDAIKDSFSGPYRYLTNFEEGPYHLTLTHYEWDPEVEDSWLEVIYLFLEQQDGVVTTREERHRLGLFAREELLDMARRCGLEGRFESLEPWDEERENLILKLTHPLSN